MKISVKDFFQDFYDSSVFHPIIAGEDMKWTYFDIAYDSIIKIDKLFNSVDRNVFRKEMMAVRMEMIALAFTHNTNNKEQLLTQSIFTKDYLAYTRETETWDIMGEYNQAIAKSRTDNIKGERAFRAAVTFYNARSVSLWDEYLKKYYQKGWIKIVSPESATVEIPKLRGRNW